MARITVLALLAALTTLSVLVVQGETLTESSSDRALLSLSAPEVNEGRELLGVGGIRAAEAPAYVGRKMLGVGGIRAAEAPTYGRHLLYTFVGTRAAEAPAYVGRKMLGVGGIRAAEAPLAGAAEAPAYGRHLLAVGGIRAASVPALAPAYKDAAVSTGVNFP